MPSRPTGPTSGLPTRPVPVAVIRAVLALLVTLALLGGTGVVAADEQGNPGKSCPGENENQGFENANVTGASSSAAGIANAALRIGCDLPDG